MVTLKRLLRSMQVIRKDLAIECNKLIGNEYKNNMIFIIKNYLSTILNARAIKFDFGKLNTNQMFRMLDNIINQYDTDSTYKIIPIIITGHSYDIGSIKDLIKFLIKSINTFGDKLSFITYRDAISYYT